MPKLKETKNKAKRRGNNEGSIYQRKDGRWCGAVTVGYKTDGKPVRKSVYGSSRQEVAKKINALTGEVFTNGYVTVSADKECNLQILMKDWFDTFVASTTSSILEEKRRCIMKNHLFETLGMLDIQNIDLIKLQRFFNGKIKEGLSVDYVKKMKNLLNNFFVYAVKKGYVRENPVTEVVIKKRLDIDEGKQPSALRPEIRQQVLTWLMERPILKPIVITFAFTGLRPQELIVLKWENIDFDKKVISVKRALNRVVEFDEEGNVISRSVKIGTTKSTKSVRAFKIPNVVENVLKEWIGYCKVNNINSEFVFPNTKNGKMRTYGGLRSLLMRFIKSHKLEDEKITLYTFRHTFATMLLEQRENPKIVADLMGHKKVSTTLDIYSHVLSSDVYEQTALTLDKIYDKLA